MLTLAKPPITHLRSLEAQRACTEYVAREFPQYQLSLIRPLKESRLTQTYVVYFVDRCGLVVKRHEQSEAFEREVLALTMFGNIKASAKLLAQPDFGERMLAIELIPNCFRFQAARDFKLVAAKVGEMHGFAWLCQRHLAATNGFNSPRLADGLAAPSEIERTLAEEMSKVLTLEYHPSSIGDF